MSRLVSNLHEAEVDFHRSLFKIRPVELHGMPNWFMARVCWATKGWGWNAAFLGLQKLEEKFCGSDPFIDHWGESKLADGETTFVTEPYRNFDDKLAREAKLFANYLGLYCVIFAPEYSWWYPRNTIRIEMWQSPKASQADFRALHKERKRLKLEWIEELMQDE